MKKQENIDERKRFAYVGHDELPDHEGFAEFMQLKDKQEDTTNSTIIGDNQTNKNEPITSSSPRVPKSKEEEEKAKKAEDFLRNWGV